MARNSEYEARFNRQDLQGKIAEELGKITNAAFGERMELAKDALETIESQGNAALYQGLILYGTKRAMELLKEKYAQKNKKRSDS